MPKAVRGRDTQVSARIPEYFKIIKKGGRYKIWCQTCNRPFISEHHLLNHKQYRCKLNRAPPQFLLQHINDEDLIKIASYLDLQSLVSMITALPRMIICHGMRALWMNTFENIPLPPGNGFAKTW